MVLAAASVDPLPLISVATARRVVVGLGAYGMGVFYGARAVSWLERRYPRLGSLVRFFERLFARIGAPLLLLAPAPTMCILAGAAGTRLVTFLIAMSLGQLLWLSATYYVGDWLSAWTDRLTALLSAHLVESTIAVALCMACYQAWAWQRGRRSSKASSPNPDPT